MKTKLKLLCAAVLLFSGCGESKTYTVIVPGNPNITNVNLHMDDLGGFVTPDGKRIYIRGPHTMIQE